MDTALRRRLDVLIALVSLCLGLLVASALGPHGGFFLGLVLGVVVMLLAGWYVQAAGADVVTMGED